MLYVCAYRTNVCKQAVYVKVTILRSIDQYSLTTTRDIFSSERKKCLDPSNIESRLSAVRKCSSKIFSIESRLIHCIHRRHLCELKLSYPLHVLRRRICARCIFQRKKSLSQARDEFPPSTMFKILFTRIDFLWVTVFARTCRNHLISPSEEMDFVVQFLPIPRDEDHIEKGNCEPGTITANSHLKSVRR